MSIGFGIIDHLLVVNHVLTDRAHSGRLRVGRRHPITRPTAVAGLAKGVVVVVVAVLPAEIPTVSGADRVGETVRRRTVFVFNRFRSPVK